MRPAFLPRCASASSIRSLRSKYPRRKPQCTIVLTGKDADLTTLPVHLQHGLDGAPYISASIDYARDAKSGFTNIGCRRLMLRGPHAAGIGLNPPSDLRALYQAAVARGARLPVAVAVGRPP